MIGWFGRKRAAKAEPVRPQRDSPPAQWASATVETAPRVDLTPQAHEQLAAVLARQPQAAALRIFVKNPGGSPPQYDMALEPANAVRPGDVAIDADGLRILVDADSLAAVDGATVDFRDDPLQPGFVVNPPEPPRMDVPDAFDTSDPLAAQVQSVLVHHVNPGIASHGGRAELVGVKDDVVYVAMGGGCQGCSMAAVTLKQGIEQILKEMIPRIRAVVDATDHAHGSNPFYTSEKGGESPFHQPAKA
jgi:Fe/S biogenesis protein NfuA